MYNLLPQSRQNILGFYIKDQVDLNDIKTLFPYIERAIRLHGNVRILSDLEDFKGFEFWSLFKVIPFLIKNRPYFYKKAIVTDQGWVESWVKFFSPFLKAQIRLFSKAEIEEAWEWVQT